MPTKEITKEEKVYNLIVELLDTKRRKKAAAQEFNEEVKHIEAEINEQIEDDIEQGEVEA